MIQGWYCEKKFNASHYLGLKGLPVRHWQTHAYFVLLTARVFTKLFNFHCSCLLAGNLLGILTFTSWTYKYNLVYLKLVWITHLMLCRKIHFMKPQWRPIIQSVCPTEKEKKFWAIFYMYINLFKYIHTHKYLYMFKYVYLYWLHMHIVRCSFGLFQTRYLPVFHYLLILFI